MHIHVKRQVYDRAKLFAAAQGKSLSSFIENALVRVLGLEGMPLDDDDIFGQEPVSKHKTSSRQ